jgi:hypothetical protein
MNKEAGVQGGKDSLAQKLPASYSRGAKLDRGHNP